MPSVEPAFTQRLRQVIAPVLVGEGFVFDERRVFRRVARGGRVHIVDVQVGDRFMAGKFTMNLAVFDPTEDTGHGDAATVREHHCAWKRRHRLGLLVPPRLPALERLPIVGFLFGPKDIWWSAHDITGLERARAALIAYGLPWFNG
jgi:hypothetical protein